MNPSVYPLVSFPRVRTVETPISRVGIQWGICIDFNSVDLDDVMSKSNHVSSTIIPIGNCQSFRPEWTSNQFCIVPLSIGESNHSFSP